jgi:hypothetical protein
MLALLVAPTLSLRLRISRVLRQATLAVLAFALLTDVTLLLIGSSVAGIRQRLLVVIARAWQLTLARSLRRTAT